MGFEWFLDGRIKRLDFHDCFGHCLLHALWRISRQLFQCMKGQRSFEGMACFCFLDVLKLLAHMLFIFFRRASERLWIYPFKCRISLIPMMLSSVEGDSSFSSARNFSKHTTPCCGKSVCLNHLHGNSMQLWKLYTWKYPKKFGMGRGWSTKLCVDFQKGTHFQLCFSKEMVQVDVGPECGFSRYNSFFSFYASRINPLESRICCLSGVCWPMKGRVPYIWIPYIWMHHTGTKAKLISDIFFLSVTWKVQARFLIAVLIVIPNKSSGLFLGFWETD